MIEDPTVKTILFVCEGNESRSQIAEALARMYGGTELEAFSAGRRPAASVDNRAVEFMGACGYDLTAHFPKGFGDIPPEEFDVAVTMDGPETAPVVRARRWVAWNLPAPDGLSPEEFHAMGVLIEERVRELLGSV